MCCIAAGELFVNGVPSTDSNHRQAYVEQNDNFYSMLTVAETLTMASQLQLPNSKSEAQKQEYVNNLMSVLGLAKTKDTRVGNEKIRGLSGGEKKRLAIGCELISSPSLLFLDEPTTGLDSFQAEKVSCQVMVCSPVSFAAASLCYWLTCCWCDLTAFCVWWLGSSAFHDQHVD